MGLATDIRYRIATVLGRRKPINVSSRRIYAYTDKVFKQTGGAPDRLVAIYKAYAPQHRD